MSVRLTTAVATTALALAAGAVAPAAVAAPVGGTPTTLRTIEVGTNPSEVAISRRLREAYVVNSSSLSVIRLGSGRVLATIPTGNGDPQVAVALGRGGRRAYVGAPDSPYVSVVDTAQRTVIDNSVLVGNGTIAIATARTAAGPRAYLAQLEQSRLGVLDTSTDQLTGYVALPRGPQSVDVAPNGKALWVGSSYSGRIWVVRMTDHKIARTIRVNRGGPVSSVAFSPDGRLAWVSGLGGVSVVNVRTGALLHFIPAPALFPRSSNLNLGPLTLNGRGTRAYVVNTTFPDHPGRGALRVIRTRDYRIAGAVATGIEPASVTSGPRGTAYVANYGSGTVSQMRITP